MALYGVTRKVDQMAKRVSRKLSKASKVLKEQDETSRQTKIEEYAGGRSASKNSSITQHSEDHFFPTSVPADEYRPREVDPPSLGEVGTYGIPVEVHKTRPDSLGPWLHRYVIEKCDERGCPN